MLIWANLGNIFLFPSQMLTDHPPLRISGIGSFGQHDCLPSPEPGNVFCKAASIAAGPFLSLEIVINSTFLSNSKILLQMEMQK